MKCRKVKTYEGVWYTLTEDEERYVRALERLSKLPSGRIELIGIGHLSVRLGGTWYKNAIDDYCDVNISCEGGDGGD